MRARPSTVLGPLDSPPCLGQRQAPRLVLMAVAVQRSPKGHRRTPQRCLGIAQNHFTTANPLRLADKIGFAGITGQRLPHRLSVVVRYYSTPYRRVLLQNCSDSPGHLNGGSSVSRGQMRKGGPARAGPREQWCGPLRSFPKEFNHPPTLLGQGSASVPMQDRRGRDHWVSESNCAVKQQSGQVAAYT